ncbi:hypothetical protein ETW23_07840 [Leisingera sp. NJS201]|uniref:hypothetical protein n=1 Tax=Leisingera sp. NJS201 TaxID=2508306 RepID=UPI001071586F|nr:hypothetical protein [Leisingera sp. NJS201]QBR36065.1 hypothetical protein ETW23_07840 [Leisingera sp. NJS201]
MPKVVPGRERAAKALCELDGHPPNAKMDGAALWVSYLPEVDAVLRAVLGDEAWAAIKEAEADGAPPSVQ